MGLKEVGVQKTARPFPVATALVVKPRDP
jgi:hypothetical protein